MIYPSDFEQRIGFDKVREQVGRLLQTKAAAELLDAVVFSCDFEFVKLQIGQVGEMVSVLRVENDFPLGGFKDINYFLKRVRIEGAFLETNHLVELNAALEMLAELVRFFENRKERVPYPLLADLAVPIGNYDAARREIERIIDKFGRVKDSASPVLQTIRRSIIEKNSQVGKRLQQILKQAQNDGIADEDSSITIRDGRALIPVMAGSKRKIRGFVHSESATGKTAFVEPVEVVELNNEIKELESDEKREIVKILIKFTDFIRPQIHELMVAGEIIADLDLILAKARYAVEIEARVPILDSKPYIYLHQARHPLLEKALKKEGKAIVPLDIALSETKHILLISGPNAGGKSVCLKTVGLLQYMVQCGFLPSTLDNSEFGIFDSIFIDIGDQQSLDNDLSTYSSHLINMKTVLREATSKSLVLIDEFGSGTEPTMGGAIAESILQKLEERGTFGVITTHYANLKYYAATAKGIENGAMTFDIQHIKPMFRLEMGRAGSSFAFEIARKIGMPEEIISMATEKIGVEQVSIEKQLRNAMRDKRYWEQKREQIRVANKNIEKSAAEYEMELSEIQKERNRLIKEAKEQAKYIVAQANRKVEQTIREIREAQAEKAKTKQVREELQGFINELDSENCEDPIERKIRLLRERAQRQQNRQAKQQQPIIEKPQKPKEIEAGFKVRLEGQGVIGEVMSVSGTKAAVAFGQLITSVELSRLQIVSHQEFKQQQRKGYSASHSPTYDTGKQRLNFSQQLDVRGMRTADVLAAVENFIDEAVMLGFSEVSILHGKGTGALKQEIRNYLGSQPVVKSTRDEHEEFGGAGITVVKLDL